MRRTSLELPEVFLIALTRGALGAGIGVLLADKLGRETRRGAGVALVIVGALTTIPLVMTVFGSREAAS